MSLYTDIMTILSGRAGSELTEEGKSLLRRLKASNSPTTGADAFALSQLLEQGELPGRTARAICEWLGYLPGSGYPLMKVKSKGENETDREESDRQSLRGGDDPETYRPGRPGQPKLRARRARSVDGEKGASVKKGRHKAHGLRGKASNNPRGRPRIVLDVDALPAGEWLDFPTAAAMMGVDTRTLRHHARLRLLPPSIQLAELFGLRRKDTRS